MKKTTVLSAVAVFWACVAAGGEKMTDEGLKKATLAGGCFWCMQSPFDGLSGVLKTTVGYTGGRTKNPSYEEVSGGGSGHLEAVEVVFDPAKTSYEEILEAFWRSIDPTDSGGQFFDRGEQYKTAIFYHDDAQKAAAEASKKKLDASGVFKKPVAVELRPAAPFYPAEEYHQKYYCKRPAQYDSYKKGSGREDFLKKMWGK